MSGWEKYVEQGTRAVMAANYMAADEITEGLVRADVQVALAAVGPLIQEDTRDRMVTAAKVAVEREGAPEWVATVVPCPACRARESGEAKATLPNRHGATVEIDLDDIPLETDRQYAFNGDEADEVWVDRP